MNIIYIISTIILAFIYLLFVFILVERKKRAYALGISLEEYTFFLQFKKIASKKHDIEIRNMDDVKIFKAFEEFLENI